jgi:hypothetical protein
VKRRELEVVASRNFLLPRLDTVGRYRWRGLGHNLADDNRQPVQFDNAYQDLTTGDFQEWQVGVEMTMPLGFRKGHAAVRNAELQLARERALLDQTEREIAHDLSAAVAEVDRAHLIAQTNYNRRSAAREQLAALEQRFDRSDEGQKIQLLNLLLDAQRRLTEAESNYFRSLLEHANAIKNVHYQKGSLLDFNEIYLTEGRWPDKAYHDAAQRERGKHPPMPGLNYILRAPLPLSRGVFHQRIEPSRPIFSPQATESIRGTESAANSGQRIAPPSQISIPRPEPVMIDRANPSDYVRPVSYESPFDPFQNPDTAYAGEQPAFSPSFNNPPSIPH